jgi:predicted phosphodiesterase
MRSIVKKDLIGNPLALFYSLDQALVDSGMSDIEFLRAILHKEAINGCYYEYVREAKEVDQTIQEKQSIIDRVNEEELPAPYLNGDPKNVLVIGDTHAPFTRKGYLQHCREVQEKFNCGTVVHIGDAIDNHYSSYHDQDPDGLSAGDELVLAKAMIQQWYKVFPKAKVCIGNHDNLPKRKGFSSGLSKHWMKSLPEVLETPNWDFALEHIIDGVLYYHGTGSSGLKAAFNRALQRRMSVVQGHLHTEASVMWNVSNVDKIFGMQVGCGVDDKSYAMAYAKTFSKKYIVSCGVVLDGKVPIVIPMEL